MVVYGRNATTGKIHKITVQLTAHDGITVDPNPVELPPNIDATIDFEMEENGVVKFLPPLHRTFKLE